MKKFTSKKSGIVAKVEEQLVVKDNITLKNLYIKLDDNTMCCLEKQDFNNFDIGDKVKFLGGHSDGIFSIILYNNITKQATNANSTNWKINLASFKIAVFGIIMLTIYFSSSIYSGMKTSSGIFSIIFFICAFGVYYMGILFKKEKRWLMQDDF